MQQPAHAFPRARHLAARCAALLLALALLTAAPTALAAKAPTAPPASEALLAAAQALDTYQIDAVFDPKLSTLTCTQRVVYTNRTGLAQEMLYFHAYANAFKREDTSPAAVPDLAENTYGAAGFDPGEIAFDAVAVDGAPVAFALMGADEAVLRVPVDALQPGQAVTLDMAYTLRIPLCGFRFGVKDKIWNLGNVFPIAAIHDAQGWRLDPYGSIGDPFYSACANYTVTLDAPRAYIAAASGALRAQETKSGRTVWRWEAPAVRDFALTLSERYKVEQKLVDGVLVSGYATTAKNARNTQRFAETALGIYTQLFGAYPYPALSAAEAQLGGYGGMEYPGFVMIDADQYERPGALEMVVAHEVAHQWWYAMVGNDEIREPWLDEALTEYSTLMYYEKQYGLSTFEQLYEARVEKALRADLPSDRTIASDVDTFSTLSEYSTVVYQRGAGMLHGLRLAVGEEIFLDVMRAYAERHRFGIATRADFIAVCNEVTGSNWQGYFDDYLDSGL